MKWVVSVNSLSLSEVKSAGRPAVFLDWGETLLYQEGNLFELHEEPEDGAVGYPPERLPVEILDRGVGIEVGWRHLADCDCQVCSDHQRGRAA